MATTNNRHPLKDSTGSRRYICILIPDGLLIDNTGDIDYGQLYAQVLYELQVQKAPYWFNNDEVKRIQQLNLNYMEQKDIAEMVNVCFRKPQEGEVAQKLNSKEMLEMIKLEYPSLTISHSVKVQLGFAMKELGYDHVEYGHVAHYKVIPLKAA